MFYFDHDPSAPTVDATPYGRIHRPDSLTPDALDARTWMGDESPSDDPDGATRIWDAARHWYAVGTQPAVQICVRHRGRIVLDRAIGHGRTPLEQVTGSTPFCLYSASKVIAAVAVWRLIDQGLLRLDDRVADLIPGYGTRGKSSTTVDHVLTHRAGVPFAFAGLDDPLRADDRDYVRRSLNRLWAVHPPGMLHIYHALTWGPLVREIVEAAAGRGIRDYVADEVTGPLGLRWTNFGVHADELVEVAHSHVTGPRVRVPIDTAFVLSTGHTLAATITASNSPDFLTSAVPSSNGVSTARELSRFAEMLLRGGEGVLRPETVARARRQRRVLRPDVATSGSPLRWGTGFMLGSHYFGPFGRRAPEAFGHTGLTHVAMWADPQRELAVAVISSGKTLSDDGGHYRALINTIAASFPAG
ncbi:CubicO group peptidase, beta-lactamase class C family [Gordonia malaquae]|uniref:Putative hydrolase n=1 Tax=Gordonia malaquae NBRC 108250 TaxID=1223542 RepID=M3UY21_GORML|nr:putative hydrolase [Gordonia malaquae NBRC 108250]SEC22432.1 CubicO group peptidase, beta-lactamase class C family [Gordonia malaquae]